MNLHTRFTLDPESGFVHDNKLNTWHTTAQEVYEAILDHSADRKPTPAEVPATGTPIESISDATRLQSICIQLWTLLDNISTASDAIKPSDEAGYRSFYAAAMKQADFRDKLLFSDGHKLFASTGLACQAPTSPLPAPSSPLQADSP